LRARTGAYGGNLPFSALELNGRSSGGFDIADLPGKRLVTSSETNETSPLNEARMKALTGGDPITAARKYGHPFEFRPVAHFWLAVNHLPVVRDDSDGFWRRLRLIRFQRKFEGADVDPDLESELLAELPGILAWAVRGAVEWYSNRLQAPDSVVGATLLYRQDSDPVQDFLTAQCVVREGTFVQAGALYAAYTEWADGNGLGSKEMLTGTAFGRRMGERFAHTKERSGKKYEGVGLLSVAADPGDGFEQGDGFDGGSLELSLEDSLREENTHNPSQPVTEAKPVTSSPPFRCGISGIRCDNCRGVPCAGSTRWKDEGINPKSSSASTSITPAKS
jgi:phage/plasmid-associated DNA primase